MPDDSKLFINWSEPSKVSTKYGPKWVRWWVIPKDYLEGFFVFWNNNKIKLKAQGYSISKNKIGQWTLNEWQTYQTDFRKDFGKDNKVEPIKFHTVSTLEEYVVKNTKGLREFQVPLVAKLCAAIKKNKAALDGSDTGAGKTYTAVAVARELKMGIAVVCPKAVMYSWNKVITQHFGMKPEFVLNYESVKTGKYKDIGVWKKVSKISNREVFHWNVPKNTLIIFDESHKLKGHGTQNSEIAVQAKKQGYKILCCSATSSVNPIEMKTVGFILGIYKVGKWTAFLREHGCEQGRFGWEFNGDKQVLKKLHYDIFTDKGIRIRREEIKDFPDCDVAAESYNMDEKSEKELKQVYTEMDKELLLLKAKCKSTKEYKINAMVIMLRSWQKAELLKVPLFIEMAEDAIEDGMSVVVFVNFSDTIRALAERLDTNCIVWGENRGTERDRNVEDFQSDKKRVILINIKAGGAGLSLHDLNGNHPRMALISPTPSAVDLVQCLGRVWRVGGKTKALQKIIFAANTVESDICDKVKLKIDNLSILNDGDLSPTPIFEESSETEKL
jgi:superfamily II DNA or RNA helicase